MDCPQEFYPGLRLVLVSNFVVVIQTKMKKVKEAKPEEEKRLAPTQKGEKSE